ncbi:DNA primase domain protein [Sagittula stellata E-37]|uniref:DNA primase domain protein n=1 Tax=Sagittula stellata (strain ATCC 700073 / DSM 11524 / E-37) TaxID=388399 RepID=A3JZX5_SAGS3|nr:DNA primase domain protein [Sagittula stellata E-37]
MITRIEEPGCKYDFMPILQGEQGKRKSTFIRMMGMGFTGELDFNYHDKKGMIESCLGRWVMEFPELVGFNKAESEHMKRFATAVEDDYRVPYE